MLDEGNATCIMSLTCWKNLGSSHITTSKTILKDFAGHFFKPHKILPSLPNELAGKNVSIEVEVIDATLNYNFLFVHT
jgi:hypothetical protein